MLQQIQEYITLFKDIFTSFAAIVAAIIAIIGLQTWKKQLRGNTEYNFARRLLKTVYAVRESIATVRNPFQSAGEIAQALKEASIENPSSDNNSQILSAQAVFQRRWKKVQEAMADLEVNTLEAEALWGSKAKDVFNPLYHAVATLFFNIQEYLRNMQSTSGSIDQLLLRSIDDVIYSSENSKFSEELQTSLSNIEEYLRPHLKL